MRTFKKIFIFLLIFFFGAFVAISTSNYKLHRNSRLKYINSELYDLDVVLDLLSHWESNYKNDQIIEEKIKHLLLNEMISIFTIKPEINKLRGTPLKALNRLVLYVKDNGLIIDKKGVEFKIYENYLLSIESEVEDTLEKRENNLKHPFNTDFHMPKE